MTTARTGRGHVLEALEHLQETSDYRHLDALDAFDGPRLVAHQLLIALRLTACCPAPDRDRRGDTGSTDGADNEPPTYAAAVTETTRAAFQAALAWAGVPASRLQVVDDLVTGHQIDLEVALEAIARETDHDLAAATMPAGATGRTADGLPATRKPKHPGYDDLGDGNTPGEDYLLYINGQPVGGTYWCGAGYIPDGQRWASWGPAGLSMYHRTRQDAEQHQIDAYTGHPGDCPECDDPAPRVYGPGGYRICPAGHLQHLDGRMVRADRAALPDPARFLGRLRKDLDE